MQHGKIVALFKPDVKGAPQIPLEAAEVIADQGIAGDRHGKPGSLRQVLLIDQAVVESVGLTPGALDENITVSGLKTSTLQRGQRVKIGPIVLEVTIPCPLCSKLETIRPGLSDELAGQRGVFTRVVVGGTLRLGETLAVMSN